LGISYCKVRIRISADLEKVKYRWAVGLYIIILFIQADELAATFNNEFKTVSNSILNIKDYLPSSLVDSIQVSDFNLALGHKGLENEALLTNRIQVRNNVVLHNNDV